MVVMMAEMMVAQKVEKMASLMVEKLVASRVALSIPMNKMIKNANHNHNNCDRKNTNDYYKMELKFLIPIFVKKL
jgi:hypothetical protein